MSTNRISLAKSAAIHSGKLEPSHPHKATICLGLECPHPYCAVRGAHEVESRFLDLCHLHLRLRGTKLEVPKELQSDMVRWRRMVVRHKSGDFRHRESEMKALKAIAQWTLQVNAQLRNQAVLKVDL